MALTPNIAIRKMSAADIAAVVELSNTYFPRALVDEGEVRRRASSGYSYFVAEMKGKIIGFVDVKMRSTSAHLGGIAVAPGMEGRGIGTILLRHALAFARKNGKAVVELVVKESNARAVRFYMSNGFAVKRMKLGRDGPVLVLRRGVEN